MCWQGCGKAGTALHGWWECKMQPLSGTVWRFLVKLKRNYRVVQQSRRVHSPENRKQVSKGDRHTLLTAALTHTSQRVGLTQTPTHGRAGTRSVICIYRTT